MVELFGHLKFLCIFLNCSSKRRHQFTFASVIYEGVYLPHPHQLWSLSYFSFFFIHQMKMVFHNSCSFQISNLLKSLSCLECFGSFPLLLVYRFAILTWPVCSCMIWSYLHWHRSMLLVHQFSALWTQQPPLWKLGYMFSLPLGSLLMGVLRPETITTPLQSYSVSAYLTLIHSSCFPLHVTSSASTTLDTWSSQSLSVICSHCM